MRLQKKDNKKSYNRLLIGIIFLAVVAGFGAFSVLKVLDIKRFNPLSIFSGFSWERVSPLPAVDPERRLTDLLSERNLPIDFPLISTSSGILAKTHDGTQIIFSTKGDFNVQVESLQIIFSRLKIEGKQASKIDLRFDRPIVVY